MSEEDWLKEEIRLINKRIIAESDKSSKSFSALTEKHDALLASLNSILIPVGVMGMQVERNEGDIKQAKTDSTKDNEELKVIMSKWEARIFKFLIAIVTAILIAIILHFLKQGMS